MNRVLKLQLALKQEQCDGLIVDDPLNLYYLTGQHLSAGTLLVDTKGLTLIVDGRYIEKCRQDSPFPVLLASSASQLPSLMESKGIKTLGFNSNASLKSYLSLKKELEPLHIALKPIDNPVLKIRQIKDPSEIALLKKAAALGSEGFDYVCTLLREGVTEAEIALELEIFWKRRGSKGAAFDPIIAFGPNSSMPHYRAGISTLQIGQPVLIDIGTTLNHYHSDMTRVVFFGEPDPKLTAIYHIVLQAQEKALELCRPGTLIGDLDAAARDVIIESGYGPQFSHSLGHGIGLEVHELPALKRTPPESQLSLEEGMVLTIEPGIYLPGLGGVRIEDTVLITANGHDNLTLRPKSLLKL